MSIGSISTFRSTATTTTQYKTKQKPQNTNKTKTKTPFRKGHWCFAQMSLKCYTSKSLFNQSTTASSSQNTGATKWPMAIHQQDLSWSMVHQEGYKDGDNSCKMQIGAGWEQRNQSSRKSTTTTKMTNKQSTNHKNNTWGNNLCNKPTNTIQILLQNAGGILPTEKGPSKLQLLKGFSNKNKIDICIIMETNANWHKTPYKFHPKQNTQSWWECAHCVTTCNRQETNQ